MVESISLAYMFHSLIKHVILVIRPPLPSLSPYILSFRTVGITLASDRTARYIPTPSTYNTTLPIVPPSMARIITPGPARRLPRRKPSLPPPS
jgi:hypothetical protein